MAPRTKEVYSFNDNDVIELFDVLMKDAKIRLPDPKHPDKVGRVDDPKYRHYHWCTHHATRNCYVLKNFIQAYDQRKGHHLIMRTRLANDVDQQQVPQHVLCHLQRSQIKNYRASHCIPTASSINRQ